MTTNSSVLESLRLQNERNDVRIYATDEETLNKETALKIQCKSIDFGWGKCILPDVFLNKKYLHIEIDLYCFHLHDFKGTYCVALVKKGDKRYVGKESFDLYNYTLETRRNDLYLTVQSWADGQKLHAVIKKIRKPAYKSPSKYFNKKENYVRTLLRNKKRVQLSKDERIIVEHLFNVHSFDPEWFFETSDINKELQLSGQMFDKIIESLIEKKLLEKELFGGGYSLYATI